MTEQPAAIETQQLRKVYDPPPARRRKTAPTGQSVVALEALDLRVRAGEFFGLLGPNGAGKTTTIGILTTRVIATGGRAFVAGVDVMAHPVDVRRRIGVVPQRANPDRQLRVRENLLFHAAYFGIPKAAALPRANALLEQFGLTEKADAKVEKLSGGQQQRLMIARALIHEPEMLFLDEPTVGLDPRIRAELLDVIATLRDGAATTILLTTHYLEEAERLCDRLAVMHRGEVVAIGAPQQLRAELGDEVVELRARDDGAAMLALLQDRGLAGPGAFTVGATVTIPLRGRSAAEVIAGIEATRVRTVSVTSRETTLDDVYLHLTGGELADAA